MKTNCLAERSRIMAKLTLLLIVGMLLLNAACWVFPVLARGYGMGFDLTATSMLNQRPIDVTMMPWWQRLGGMLLSSVPLLVLAWGLNALRRLFLSYACGDYFSPNSSQLLGRVGRGVALWVLASFVLEPVLTVWLTMLAPPGQRMVTLSFGSPQLVALFLAAAVMLIARILGAASAVAQENDQFI